MANSLFKAYAKQAKKRLKEGFWSDVKNQRNYFELVAATTGSTARRRSFTDACAVSCLETRL